MDFHKLVNKLYEIESSNVMAIDIQSLKPPTAFEESGPNLVNESYDISPGKLSKGVPSGLSSFLKMAGISTKSKIVESYEHVYETYDTMIQKNNPSDTVTLDIPLLIRLLEYAREDASSDIDLHNVAENMIKMDSHILTMDDYDSIIPRKIQKRSSDPRKSRVAESISQQLMKAYKEFESKK